MTFPREMCAPNCAWIGGTLRFIRYRATPVIVRLSAPGVSVTSPDGFSTAWVAATDRENGFLVMCSEGGSSNGSRRLIRFHRNSQWKWCGQTRQMRFEDEPWIKQEATHPDLSLLA